MEDIDIVYLWVDGNDPKWEEKKLKFTGDYDDSDNNCSARFINNDELKYSLRSIEKFMPWIRNVFIVTDNQIPQWLNTHNPHIKIIDHKDILPPQALPCFNSVILEHFIYKIPGLSEKFLYSNDDMFVAKPLSKYFFFGKDDLPIIMLSKRPFRKLEIKIKKLFHLHISTHQQGIINASNLIKKKFHKTFSGEPHHNIDSYLKSTYKKVVEDVYHQEIFSTLTNHIRQPNDIQRIIFSYYSLAVSKGHLKYTSRRESARLKVHKPNFMKYLKYYSPKLFCVNDNQHATESDRKQIRPFLEELYPNKSKYEK